MPTSHIVVAIITGIVSIVALVIALLQFKEKGPIFTNSYLLASPQERQKLNRKAEYRLAAVVFTVLCVLFAVVTTALVAKVYWLNYLAIAGGVGLVVFVIIQAIKSGEFH